MPGKVKVKVVSGRNLPIMDRSNLTTDAYVEVKLGSTIYKTDVYRKSLNPVWNSEWFRFEMDDLELQDEPLQIRLMDHDTYSSNDAIGKVYLDLNPLLCNSSRGKDTSGKMISGWIPVYDTMHGIRGEVNLIVKVELFSDLNKFRQSSCGVRFFFTQSVPEGYIAHIMQGFVEELVVNDDPEYQWIDKIRTPRASNEARQTLFSKLSGEVQRKVGLKALELGGNAVIGYKQCFDLEGESGIVVRGIGTAAYLTKQYESQLSPTCGEALGLSREVTDLQGYPSAFTKHYSRSLRRRGCPGRAPRLQRRSFRVTGSSDSMCVHHQLSKDDLDEAIKKRCHHDDTCCVLGRVAANAGGGVSRLPSSCAGGAAAVLATRHGSIEGFKERRSASFREDSLMRLVKFHLKKSHLTSSTQSIPPSTSSTSAAHYNKDVFMIGNSCNTKVPIEVASHKGPLIVATSEPCIEVSSLQCSAGEGLTKCPSFTTTSPVPASPLPHKSSKSVSLTTPNSTSCRSRSTSRSPLCNKSRHNNLLLECSSAVIHENDIADSSCRLDESPLVTTSIDEPCDRSRSALASCMMTHHRTLSETMSPGMSSPIVQNKHDDCRTLSRSVNNLNQIDSGSFAAQSQIIAPVLGYLGSGGVDFESAGSNIDSNADEDSISDTSLRYLYGCGGETVTNQEGGARVGPSTSRARREIEIESDTSKDCTKATSSGNDACSVDNDELSPVSEREGFLLMRKKRGSRRKDRYSKSSLVKRASTNFYERGLLGTERIREEVAKFFKRKKSSDDNESCSSSTTKNMSSSTTAKKCAKVKSSPYREAKFFFRRRKTTSNNPNKNLPNESNPVNYSTRSKSSSQLFRSNSDSHSLGQTSLDSMPSVGSEPLFDEEDDDSTRDILPDTATDTFYLSEKIVTTTVPALKIPEADKQEKGNQSVIKIEDESRNVSFTKTEMEAGPSVNPVSHNVLQLDRSKIIEIIKELGYSTDSPLKLYISSMDALLVYDPSDEPSSMKSTASGEGGVPATIGAAATQDKFDAASGGGYAAISTSSASALSQHSCAFKPAISHASTDSNYSQFCGISSYCSSTNCCCSRHNSNFNVNLGSPSSPSRNARSPRFLCRHGTVKARPFLHNSESESTNTSALNSFSTLGSSSCRLGEVTTTDSFSSVSAESARNSFSVLNQVICSHNGNSWLLGRMDNDKCSNCLMVRTNNDDSATSDRNSNAATAGTTCPSFSCPIHHNCNASGSGDHHYYHPVAEEDSSKESILLYRANCYGGGGGDSCEDILEVVTVRNSSEDVVDVSNSSREREDSKNVESRKTMKEEAELNEHVNIIGEKSDEQIGVAGCTRSPIPEELLFDRTTPTLPSLNQPCGSVNYSLTTLVGGGSSNASTATTVLSSTAVTNNISQNVSATIPFTVNTNNSVTVTNNSNSTNINTVFVSRQGGCVVAHHLSDANANNSTTGTTASTNNNALGTCGGEVSKRLVVGINTSPEENPAVNGARNVVSLDEAGKESLVSSSPCPSHPNCEPQFNQQRSSNGLAVNFHHRHPLQHQTACKEMMVTSYSQEAAVDSADSMQNEFGENLQDRNGGSVSNKGTPKTPNILCHPGVSRIPSTGAAAFLGPNHAHAHMTTTILTSGTGTIPVVVGGSSGVLHRRSSESDLSTPPKPNAMSASIHMRGFPTTGLKPGITTTIDQYGLMEYPFITISQFPPGFLTHIGGTVTARSVKLLERISNLEEPESRDAWWNEIRMEIRAHCRAFGCTVVVGYEEHTTMCDDVCVLSASGTAAIAATTIGLKNVELLTVSTKKGTTNSVIADTPCPGRGVEKDRTAMSKMDNVITNTTGNGAFKHLLVTPSKLRHDSDHDQNCSMLHIPSNPAGLPFPVKMSRCHVCRKGRVPDVLIVTVDVPPGLHITGKGTLIQAQVFRPKKDCKGEISAKEVSDSLPFLEYELHRRLINKLKVKGMNAIFGLKVQICLGDRLMVAVATGTAMYVTALPPPGVPIITAGNLKTDAQKVLQYQKVVQDAYDRNRQHYDLKSISIPTNGRQSGSSGEESEEEETADVHSSNKDTYILEVDDAEDIDIISMLIDPHPTTAFLMNNIDYLHGYEEHHVSSQQMFTQVWRCRIPTLSLRQFTAYFERLIRAVCFKLRKMMPCVLSKLSFTVELPEPDEMQISIIGLALGMTDQSKIATTEKLVTVKSGSVLSVAKEDSELMFTLEEDGSASGSTGNSVASGQQPTSVKSGDLSASNNEGSRDLRITPPPSSGILVPVVGQINNSGVVLVPRTFPHQPCTLSSSPHSHCSSHLSGNGCGHVIGSGTAAPLPTAHAPQLSKFISGDSTAGNLASSSSSILPGHGVNYSFRGGTTSHSQQPFTLSRTGSKVIPKSALQFSPKPKFNVEITPLSYIPGARIEKYLGNLNFFFIRETTSIRENGGLSGFVHNFVAEILAIVRAHVAALGGNAMVSYFMTELSLLHNPHKNQGQCLINVGGDVVLIVHPSSLSDENQLGS